MTGVPHTLVHLKKESHTKAACRLRAAALLPFFWGGGLQGGWGGLFSLSLQDKDGKGERIRAEALVV